MLKSLSFLETIFTVIVVLEHLLNLAVLLLRRFLPLVQRCAVGAHRLHDARLLSQTSVQLLEAEQYRGCLLSHLLERLRGRLEFGVGVGESLLRLLLRGLQASHLRERLAQGRGLGSLGALRVHQLLRRGLEFRRLVFHVHVRCNDVRGPDVLDDVLQVLLRLRQGRLHAPLVRQLAREGAVRLFQGVPRLLGSRGSPRCLVSGTAQGRLLL
mmetsp:Transcript_6981/g.18841  ORF Transcript_6981/g.18841 Transcript_6981/m.18841 type:complete len:212 (+) Transcript_6981:665-1300(+)